MFQKHRVWLWFDPTSRCNLKCALCYTKDSHGATDLTAQQFGQILDNIYSDPRIEVEVLHLNWRGEPLMSKHFPELLQEIRKRSNQPPMHWHTNGTVITRKLARRILDNSPDNAMMYVSIDGGTEKAHDANRGAGTFRKSLKGLRTMLDERGDKRTPKVALYQLDLGEDVTRYDPEFVELAARADSWVRVNPMALNGSEESLVEASSTDSQPGPDRVQISRRVPHGPCFWAGNALCISAQGDVHVCLLSHTNDGVFGNLLRDPVFEVVTRARTFRSRLAAEGRKSLSHCRSCSKPCGDAHEKSVEPPQVVSRVAPSSNATLSN